MRCRLFVCGCVAAAWILGARLDASEPVPLAAGPAVGTKLSFVADGKEFRFDTGILRGGLRPQGRSLGLAPVIDVRSGLTLSGGLGLFSLYRLLDSGERYGGGAWDFPSQARLLPDGSVEATWPSRQDLPFEMSAAYRWNAPNVLDLVITVRAGKDLQRFEVFLASYFNGFAESLVYVKETPNNPGKPGLLRAEQSNGNWQMFPRDDAAVKIIRDGRWKRPPHPVDWTIMPVLAGPLGVRRDPATGLTALVMAPPADCFAVATPYGEEGHRSVYLSLFGRDLKAGQAASARARLVIGRDISEVQAIAIYEAYAKEHGK